MSTYATTLEAGIYRFVGSVTENCALGSGYKAERFGHPIKFAAEDAHIAIAGGGAWIPDHNFKSIGFSDEQLRRYPFHGMQIRAPLDFQEKKRQAQDVFRNLYLQERELDRKRAEEPMPAPAPVPDAAIQQELQTELEVS